MPRMTAKDFEVMAPLKYSDWFGKGSTLADYKTAVKNHGTPVDVIVEDGGGAMLLLIYRDKIVCTGYDGNEYCHTFVFHFQELEAK